MTKNEKQQIITQVLGALAVEGKQYHSPLAPELADWYVYTRDSGHSILCLLTKDVNDAFSEGEDATDYLLPVPVKTVLNHFPTQKPKMARDFIVVDFPYSPQMGLVVDEKDEEF